MNIYGEINSLLKEEVVKIWHCSLETGSEVVSTKLASVFCGCKVRYGTYV